MKTPLTPSQKKKTACLYNGFFLNISYADQKNVFFYLRFTRLTRLSLDNNLLSTCKGLGGLESLQSLRLDGNRITDTRGLARLTNLTSLDLSRNQIKKLQVC